MAYRAEANCGCQMELDTGLVTYCKVHDKPLCDLERRAALVPELVAALEKLTIMAIRVGEMHDTERCVFCSPDSLDRRTDGVRVETRLNGCRVVVYHEATCEIVSARAALARAKAVMG